MADTVVVDEPWFWARTGDAVHTNGGNSRARHGGADFICLLIPNEFGILARVVKLVDGQAAEVVEFVEITLGQPLDDGLFQPLS